MTPREQEHRARLEQSIDNMEKTSTCLDIFDRALADARRAGRLDMIEHLASTAKALPVQHEQENLGQCTYNWYRHVEKLLREYAKAQAAQEEG